MASDYELSGSFEQFGRRNDPEAVARLQKFVKEHTPPGQPPRLTHEIKAEFEKLHGPMSALLSQDFKPLGEKFNREFKVWVRDNTWCIHTRLPGSDPKTGWEHFGDGHELSMSLLTPEGGTMGWIGSRPDPVPHSLSDFGAAILWTMTASGPYFDTVTNNLVRAAHMTFGGGKPGEPEPDRRQPCAIERREGKPGLPMMLAFRTADGKTNASYRAIGFREFGKLSLPSGFVWENYSGTERVGNETVGRVNDRIVARITNFVATCTRADLHPRVIPGMGVADYRVKAPTNLVATPAPQTPAGNPTNAITNVAKAPVIPTYGLWEQKWPSVAKAQDMVDGRKRTAKKWIAAAVGAVMLLGGAVWWLRRRWRRPFMPVRPPTDVPGA